MSTVTPLPSRDARAAAGAGGAPASLRVASLTPPQRAAVVIALMGEGAAKPIVEKLDDAAVARMAAALETITYLSRDDLVEIVIDFLTQLRSTAGAMRGGRGKAREVMSGIVEPGRLNAVFGGPSTPAPVSDEGDAWERLSRRDPKQVADYLGRLTPNIIALILRRLDPSVSSNIICHLKDDRLQPVMAQMVEAPRADAGIDTVIARMVEMEFLNLPQDEAAGDDGHLETIGEVLSLIPTDKRENLVGFLQSRYESKLPVIQKGLFTVEGLPDLLPRAGVPAVLREIEQAKLLTLLASLSGRYQAAQDYLLSNISSRMADQYREDIKSVRAPAGEEAETIQREFLTQLMDMRRRGIITINKPDR
ncbi:FliG C-terminal domain-containing protein [Hyphomonas sp.]|uniref:FliG C-terminal domain-containing protein n=1 Tax=Hyphomonas sp. TaxID=87 RepID=UPI00391CACEF